ncbi:hypothetical protein AGMMS49991_08080 [Spirochaetia bacterium]|nr:hypothetical protein AGMMS49991_08080 [Spirochaetia bacterium]
MKKLLFIIPVFLVLAGCWPYSYSSYQWVRYESIGPYEGDIPKDSTIYRTGDTATVLDPGTLTLGEGYTLAGWYIYDGTRLYQPGDTITVNGGITFSAVWKYQGEDYKFDVNDAETEATLTRYIGPESYHSYILRTIPIPDTVGENHLPVTGIADGVFRNTRVSELTLPVHLKSIGFEAFSRHSLNSIVIPDSVTAIGDLAFQGNYLLSRLELGSGLETIGAYAFKDNALTNVVIPPGVTRIGNGAFQGNEIIQIEIGDSVAIEDERSMGNHGKSFQIFYTIDKGSTAGLYKYDKDAWQKFTADAAP